MNHKIVSIHQPNFFPWLGYFDKIVRSDAFVFMDNVQFPKTGSGTWINRVKLLVSNEPKWITMPVRRSGGIRQICDTEIDNSTPWREKLLNTIRMNYSRARHYQSVEPLITKLVNFRTDLLVEYNINAITSICSELGLDVSKLLRGSEQNVVGNATDLLIAMTQAAGGTTYMCGGGANGYQVDDKFAQAKMKLEYQNFGHPNYSQLATNFTPGLSIIDALFNCGISEVKEMLKIPT